jgi:hypothetical protein
MKSHQAFPIHLNRILLAMQNGETLRLAYGRGDTYHWLDPSGRRVPNWIADAVKRDPAVNSARDGLWAATSQSWTWRNGGRAA